MKSERQRIVVTGGDGFVGRNLIQRLAVSGMYSEIVSLDRNEHSIDGATSFTGEFADQRLLKEVVKAGDTVVHLACTTLPATSEADPKRDFEENVLGTIALLEHCGRAGIKDFLFMSSGGTVYGDHGCLPLSEEFEAKPINRHGHMKLAIERQIIEAAGKFGFGYLIIRGGNPYGRSNIGKRPQGAIDVFLDKALKNEQIEIWGDGEQRRDYLHIGDLTNLVCMALSQDVRNEIFNAGSGTGHSLNEIISAIGKLLDKPLDVAYHEQRAFDVQCNILSMAKAKRVLGWEPSFNLEQGLNDIKNKLA